MRAINRSWASDSINLDMIIAMNDDTYPTKPSIGIVIGTFASIPYVHLHLESRTRNYHDVPILIHDDGSNQGNELKELCTKYKADFEFNTERQPHCIGDMTAFAGGLLWAKAKNLDILVKMSRRWLFKVNFIEDLQKLALMSQYPTICNYTTTFNFGFRTECIAMSVAQWSRPDILERILTPIRVPEKIFVEGYMHNIARDLERQSCTQAKLYRIYHPITPDKNGYAFWDLMGNDRIKKSQAYLWHDANDPVDYAELAKQWSLPYVESDFRDPNAGQGIGNPVI